MREYWFLFFTLVLTSSFGQQRFDKTLILMGSRFDISVIAQNETEGNEFINLAIDEIKRIENLISSWDSNSQTFQINKNAGIKPVKVDSELFDLINRSIRISKLTNGAFDISYASMDKIWKFDGSMKTKPAEAAIKSSVVKVGFKNILMNEKESTVYLKTKGMKIGFGGIGKGYAADKAKSLLQKKGVVAGIINASGDMNTWGNQIDGSDWTVGIKNPLNKNKVFALIPINNSAVVTSGNYEKFVEFNGIRYSHIINPLTGYPSSGIVSASVFAKSAELSDALATSIFVMGVDVGLDFINQLKGVDCIIVNDIGKVYYSDNIEIKNKL